MLAEEKLEKTIKQLEKDNELMAKKLEEFQEMLIKNSGNTIKELAEKQRLIESLQKQLSSEQAVFEEPVATDGIDLQADQHRQRFSCRHIART